MELDVGHTLAVHAVIGHVEAEYVGVSIVEDALSQDQVHAVAARGGGVQIQHQRLVPSSRRCPPLTTTDPEDTSVVFTCYYLNLIK